MSEGKSNPVSEQATRLIDEPVGTVADAVDEISAGWRVVRPDLDVSALDVFGRLHRGFLLYQGAIQALFAKVGSSEPGFDVMAALRRAEPKYTLTAGELAQQTLVTTGGLTLRVKRLEQDGFVVRHRDKIDQRVVHVQLTAAGLQHIDKVSEVHFANLDRLLADMPADDQRQLARLLADLFESMRAADPEL